MERITRDVPKWSIYQHREARGLKMVDKDDAPARQLEDEIFDRFYAGNVDATIPTDKQGPLGQWATRLHTIADTLPSFQRLTLDCRDDADASATAVEILMKELDPHMRAETEASKPMPDAAIRKGLTRVAVKAAEVIAENREAAETLAQVQLKGGKSAGTGSAQGGRMDDATPRQIAARLRTDPRLKRIAMLAGKFQRIAARKQRTKVDHGADEISDVETGSDVARLLPVELARLMHPLRKLALMRDLIENRALQYQMKGTDTLGKGPIIVCLDKSSSMEGAADEWATAVALALMTVAQRQKRRFAMVAFDHGIKSTHIVDPGGSLPEEALFTSCAGGTDIHAAVAHSLTVVESTEHKLRTADVVLITDGGSDVSCAPAYRTKAAQLGVTSLGFGIGVLPATLAPWCDEAQAVSDLTNVDDRAAEVMFTL